MTYQELENKALESEYKRNYARVHYWLRKNYGYANKCESKECDGKSKYFTWALIKGKKYEYNRKNFKMLCKACHTKYDLTEEGKKRIVEFLTGRPGNNQTEGKKIIVIKDGKKYIFDKIKYACEKFGVGQGLASNWLNNRYKTNRKGLIFKYYE